MSHSKINIPHHFSTLRVIFILSSVLISVSMLYLVGPYGGPNLGDSDQAPQGRSQDRADSNHQSASSLNPLPILAPPPPLGKARALESRALESKTWGELLTSVIGHPQTTSLKMKGILTEETQYKGLIARPLSDLKPSAEEVGFTVGSERGLPQLRGLQSVTTLQVVDGYILGADILFEQSASAASWSFVCDLLTHGVDYGADEDPMLILDQHGSGEQETKADTPLSGSWSLGGSSQIHYQLRLNSRGEPMRARLWISNDGPNQ